MSPRKTKPRSKTAKTARRGGKVPEAIISALNTISWRYWR
jgi:hypothetical protein